MESHLPESPRTASATPRLETMDVEPLMTRDYETRPAFVYERLRAKYGPVAPVDLYGLKIWLVLGYQEVLEVLRNENQWKKDPKHWKALQEGRVPPDWPMLAAYQVSHTLLQDDQQRKESRAAIEAALRPYQDPGQPQAAELEAAVARQTDELITFFADGGTTGWADLSAEFARPLPLLVINRLFGFPVEQTDDIFMDAWRMMDSGPDAAEAIGRLNTATSQLAAYKRKNPGDDLTSRLIEAGPHLSDEQIGLELYAMLIYSDHITQSITHTVLEVLTGNTRAQASLSVGTFHELVNRVHIASPPWRNLALRYPVSDVVLGDFHIAAGDAVMPSVAAAHGDPMFAKALNDDSVMSTRAHLAWGAGPHQCPSRDLAEMVSTTAVSRLFERCDLELGLPVDQLPWRSSSYIRGLKSFPVKYTMRQLPPGARPDLSTPVTPAPAAEPGGGEPESPAQPQQRPRSRLWRFLASLRGGANPRN